MPKKDFTAALDRELDTNPAAVMRPLDTIRPNPDQPRTFSERPQDDPGIKALAENIRRHGLLQPILIDGTGMIILGERRFHASRIAGLDTIAVIIGDDSLDADMAALSENIVRLDLHPLEEARAYKRLMDQRGWTQADLARALGSVEEAPSKGSVSERLSLLELPEEFQETWLSDREHYSIQQALQRVGRRELKPAAKRQAARPAQVTSALNRATDTVSRVDDPSKWSKQNRTAVRKQLTALQERIATLLEQLEE